MIKLTYKGELFSNYSPLCFLILKGREGDRAEHKAQILNYLKATGMKLGLLVNFGSYPNAEIERRIL